MTFVDKRYEDIIFGSVAVAAGVGVGGIFVPTLDMAGIGVTWTAMVLAIADESDLELDGVAVAKLVTSAVGGVSAYVFGSKVLTWLATPLILAYPIAGIPAAIAVNATLNALFTLRLGAACASKFSRPDFKATDLLDVVADIVGLLLKMPKREEIKYVKAILAARHVHKFLNRPL